MARKLLLALTMVVMTGSVVISQVRTGAITGAVKDEQGAVVPGVSVVLTGERVLGQVTAVTLENGSFNFRALEPGTYDLRFELSGFQTLNREGIIVAGGRTITLNVTLSVASVTETITVTGESPLVDVKQTHVGASFNEAELQEVPSATDMWAVLGQSPGVRMLGYDVGGSHKSQQIGYESFGIRLQNQVISEGVNSTEGVGWAAIYYDYYAVEEYKVSAVGADVEMMTPGAAVVMTIKSGGNEPSSLVNMDFEPEEFVGDNVDDETAARGFTGNPNLKFWELHADYGGPIVRDKAWIYGAYNHFTIDKAISGVDPSTVIGGIPATDLGLFDNFTAKLTWQVTEKDKFVGYSQWNHKEKPNRGLSASIPPESVRAQDYWAFVHKAEWQRVWNDRVFTDVQLNHFGSIWPMVPKVDPRTNPPRIEDTTGVASGAGWIPFTQNRWKPHVNATGNYYVPDAAGSHDFKFGYHFQLDSSQYGFNANSGPVRYRDFNGVPGEILLTDFPAQELFPDTRDRHNDFFAQDIWTLSDRLTLSLGFRYSHQRLYYLETQRDPVIGEFFPFLQGFFDSSAVPGGVFNTFGEIAPRIGATIDLTGKGRTVLKTSYGRYYVNIAEAFSGAHPASAVFATHDFNDLDGDGVLSSLMELGPEISRTGGGGAGTRVDTSAPLPHSDEYQLTLEHQFTNDAAVRATYVRKTMRNAGIERFRTTNLAQAPFLTVPFQTRDPGDPTNVLNLVTTPAGVFGTDDVITTYPEGSNWNYDTIEVAMERRFGGDFFLQGSFDYQWREEARDAQSESTSPLDSDPIEIRYFQNHNPSVPVTQESTSWGFKGLARYAFPAQIAVSTNLRVQGGFTYSRIIRLPIFAGTGVESPGARSLGTKGFFAEDINNNRSETVPIWDLRVDKTFETDVGQFMIMADLYNVLNSNAVTNFFLRTGSFERIIATLDPRTFKIGFRWTY